MISRPHRFHGHNSLNHVYRKGKVARSQFVNLKYIKNKGDYRVAVVVSKKVSKKAVIRNRIRRRIFEIVRKCYKNSPEKNWQFDMVFSAFDESLASMDHAEIEKNIIGLLKKPT